MPQRSRNSDILRALAQEGFSPRRSYGGRKAYEGVLKIRAGAVPVRLEIEDWNFLEYPTIRLLQRPSFLPALMPHVTASGHLCYLRPESLVLDRYNPTGSLLRCLEQARQVLQSASQNDQRRVEELQDEFLSYWVDTDASPRMLLGTIESGAVQAHFFTLEPGNSKLRIIASSESEVKKIACSIGRPQVMKSSGTCRILRSSVYPAAPDKLPDTIQELFFYLRLWDPQLSRSVQRVLEHDKSYLASRAIAFVVHTPAGWLGFGFELDELTRKGYANKPALYKQYLHQKGGCRRIFRFVPEDVSPQFIHSRNLHHPDLAEKRITLIGCGAIGGYLAKALASLGAGTGARGVLTLYDPGLMSAENIGRHVLGLNSIHMLKADAVADELKRHFPGIRIDAIPKSVVLTDRLLITDLLIDATGSQAVAEMLNHFRLSAGRVVSPFLYVWVQGNGEAVQSLWTDSTRHACVRCLRKPHGPQYLEDRFRLLREQPKEGFKGCRAFTPYAVSAPMSAAALAVDVVIDWLKGDVSPRFRTRAIERANVNRIKNQDVEPLEECPACRPR